LHDLASKTETGCLEEENAMQTSSATMGWLSLVCALALTATTGCDEQVKKRTNPGGQGGTGAIGGSGGDNPGGGGTGAEGGSGGGGAGGGYTCDDPVDLGVPPSGPRSDKVDLLLVVDNSRSMADKQEILQLGVADMVGRFTNPRCVDASGAAAPTQPASPDDACPSGYDREMAPVEDLHIGVISSSIGGHGADACDPGVEPTGDDQAHLLTRNGSGGTVSTYDDLGFLAWDPAQTLSPPGENDQASLESDLEALIGGAGDVGCGYEAPLEAWYRFLVEPDPHASISLMNNSAVLEGTDQTVLDSRAEFLRDDSTVVIVMLTDENDCSIRDGGQYYFAAQIYQPGSNNPYHLPKPRAACATDPNDPCCRSCGQAPGDGCDTSQDDCSGALSSLEDNINLRCFDQKRRFGIDFLWPTDRYTTGLTATQVSDRHGNVVANPLFANGRSPSQVYLTGIVGVPWQDLARRDANGSPDLAAGLNGDGDAIGGLQSARELEETCTWDLVLGDPEAYVAPLDPMMIESIEPRSGSHPLLGDAAAPPGSDHDANRINGHEFSTPQRADLQYACIMPLLSARDCTSEQNCDCTDPDNDNPICQDPATNAFGMTQYAAKAYPGRRHLSVLRSLGHQGILGSICAPQLDDEDAPDFGYRTVFDSIGENVKRSILEP
jgi:hypothetical protein